MPTASRRCRAMAVRKVPGRGSEKTESWVSLLSLLSAVIRFPVIPSALAAAMTINLSGSRKARLPGPARVFWRAAISWPGTAAALARVWILRCFRIAGRTRPHARVRRFPEKALVGFEGNPITVRRSLIGVVVRHVFARYVVNEAPGDLLAEVLVSSREQNEHVPHLIDFSADDETFVRLQCAHHEKSLHFPKNLAGPDRRSIPLVDVSANENIEIDGISPPQGRCCRIGFHRLKCACHVLTPCKDDGHCWRNGHSPD